jgi:hypothetical protein
MAKTLKRSSQRLAFQNAARELGADEAEEKFDAALKKIARHKSVADPMPTNDPEAMLKRAKRNIPQD